MISGSNYTNLVESDFKKNNLMLPSFPGGSDSKESACNGGDLGSIPGFGKSAGKGNDIPLQYSCLENPKDRGACDLKSMGFQRVGHDCASECSYCLLAFAFLI